ncbi:MAG: 2-oxoacid:ferredoxin oxidoreductase subunit beta [Bacteroidota bacterium]|nr:2-oxoacid:ferredoxin oxidoreductase subunit beta [Candidatus Kapabacteria bacterium]MDW8219641.1 2-oxoacid:ferredoxin oxidoreductase subunit beta [Bacteroidota bacterium]
MNNHTQPLLSVKDFRPHGEVQWCPGCGNYAVLSQLQKLLSELGIPRENIVFISGIGCSSRLPYYINTYGFHTIHGRAPAVATGLKLARPELSIWIVSGDGDALSIGGNHTIHLLRRNVDVTMLLLNNQVYGLTKGQYSPTSRYGQITASSPYGMMEHHCNPLTLALGAGGAFVARTIDRDLKHLSAVLRQAAEHKGASFVEIYQNCIVFNGTAFDEFVRKDVRDENILFVEHGMPLVFGYNRTKGIRLDGLKPYVVSLDNGMYSVNDVVVYDERDATLAFLVAKFSDMPEFPHPVGVLYRERRLCYGEPTDSAGSIRHRRTTQPPTIESLLSSVGSIWKVE